MQKEELDLEVIAKRLHVFLDQWGQALKRVMPLAMCNLAIAEQRDKKWYMLVRGVGWDLPKATLFRWQLKHRTESTLEALARPHILRVVEIRPTGVAVLEGSDVARIWKYKKTCAHCPHPILDPNMYPERFYRDSFVYYRV